MGWNETTKAIEEARTGMVENPMTTAGDIIVGGVSGVPARLAKGTANQVVGMNSGATAQEYKASLQSLMTAQGDIVYASSANTPARLAKGNENQTLAAGATVPEYRNTGFLKFNEKTASGNLAATDAAIGAVDANHATVAIVLTLPKDTFAIGDTIVVFRQGAAATSVKAGADCTLNGVATGEGAISTQYQAVTIRCIASNTFMLYGDHGVVA